jgi:hypothetical protein
MVCVNRLTLERKQNASAARIRYIISTLISQTERNSSTIHMDRMEEGRKRVLAIVAEILVARHLKSMEDLVDKRGSPRTEAMVAAAVQRAERIMRKIDSVFGTR